MKSTWRRYMFPVDALYFTLYSTYAVYTRPFSTERNPLYMLANYVTRIPYGKPYGWDGIGPQERFCWTIKNVESGLGQRKLPHSWKPSQGNSVGQMGGGGGKLLV
jgi:hypothetical protein